MFPRNSGIPATRSHFMTVQRLLSLAFGTETLLESSSSSLTKDKRQRPVHYCILFVFTLKSVGLEPNGIRVSRTSVSFDQQTRSLCLSLKSSKAQGRSSKVVSTRYPPWHFDVVDRERPHTIYVVTCQDLFYNFSLTKLNSETLPNTDTGKDQLRSMFRTIEDNYQ